MSRSPTSAPVAQHGDPVGNLEHLVETMRDIDHADAARLQRPQRGEEAVHLVGRQRSRRFVEHKNVGLTLSARAIATRDFSVRVRSRTRMVGSSGQST